jgi:hypothetical protein
MPDTSTATALTLVTAIEQARVDSLAEYPGNPRIGDVDAIAASLAANGQFAPVVAQVSTRYVLAGNHTVKAAAQLGWETIAVTWVDVDAAAAKRIVLAANRTAERGSYDQAALAEMLTSLDGDYAGSGWDAGDHDALLKLLAPPPLDDLAGKHGEPTATGLWPVVRVQVAPHVHAAWTAHVKTCDGDQAAALAALLGITTEGTDTVAHL